MKVTKNKGSLSSKKPTPVDAPDDSAFELPTKLSRPLVDIGEYITLLYGLEKIGKTTLASHFPDAVFLMFEPGGRALSIYQQPVVSWAAFKKAVKLLMKDRRFKTVVVDTVDLCFKKCEQSVCRKLGIDHPSDEDWGKGWNAIRDEFTAQMATLMSLGKGVVLISHEVEREIKRRDGGKYHVIGPSMAGQAKSVIQPMVDIWARYGYEDKRRTLTVRGDEHIMAGVRPEKAFLYNGKQLTDIDMGASSAEAYANFTAAFNNKYVPAKREKRKDE